MQEKKLTGSSYELHVPLITELPLVILCSLRLSASSSGPADRALAPHSTHLPSCEPPPQLAAPPS
uniref:Uncharacterized protein n=1 Tax=Arundo donax TaxID=35708 RepID=A0A0A8ZPH1_ARUDO